MPNVIQETLSLLVGQVVARDAFYIEESCPTGIASIVSASKITENDCDD